MAEIPRLQKGLLGPNKEYFENREAELNSHYSSYKRDYVGWQKEQDTLHGPQVIEKILMRYDVK